MIYIQVKISKNKKCSKVKFSLIKMDVDLLKPLDQCFEIWKFIGFYNDGKQSWKRSILGFLFFMTMTPVVAIGEIIRLRNSKNFEEAVEALSIVIPTLIFILQIINIQKQLASLIPMKNKIEEIFAFSQEKRFKNQKLQQKIRIVLRILQIFIGNCYLITIMITCSLVIFKTNPYNAFGVRYEDSPFKFYLSGVHLVVTSLHANLVITFVNLLPIIYMSYASGFLEELADRFQTIGTEPDYDKDELVKCIKIHRLIIEFVKEIKSNFGFLIFCQCVLSQLIISLIIFNSSTRNGIFDTVHVMAFCFIMVLEVFLPCFFGQQIIASSEKLSNSIFHSHCWQSMKSDSHTDIKILMENLKNPIKISIFGLFNVDLVSFTRIIESAYKLYVVLKNLNQK